MIKQTKAALAEAKAELDRLSLLQCIAQRRYDDALEAYDRACLDAAATRISVRKIKSDNPRFIRNRSIETILSPLELEAIRLKINGYSYLGIDKAMGNCKRTASTRFARAKEKLGLETNSQLFEFAKRALLMESP